ncbi:helix-turn-helix domain-containing protein [Deinococcus sp. NW-56]|uniref:XRE family transcriptional regulator n=1 Tax=Deinococcus sp. NW-56 TaxID=2080419 RepID=UPI001F43DDDE|nr:helix-turn-helix domain-containing protein [Deinococcus sp. NW-56]
MFIGGYDAAMPDGLSPVDQRIREAMRLAMEMRSPRLTQAVLAERLGISQPAVAALLSGRRGQIPQSLVDLLEALDLELTVQPKERQ